MFFYYLGLALRSLGRSPILSCLLVLAIGLGIGASMTMITVLHVMDGDPLPGRSGTLYSPHLNPLPLDYHSNPYSSDPSDSFTWPDAMALIDANRAEHQAAMVGGRVLIHPVRAGTPPFYTDGRHATSQFFAMFGVPFVQGRGWSAEDDADAAHVVVLSQELSKRLFGTAKSVGFTVQMDDTNLRVVGVTGNWEPRPMFYGMHGVFDQTDRYFLPLSTAIQLGFDVTDELSSFRGAFNGDLKSPDLTWLQVWVQLDGAPHVAAYRQFLINYSAQQTARGRFQQPPKSATLTPLMDYLQQRDLVPSDVKLQLWISLGFLFVSMLNVSALLLAKILRRSGEVSIRRAMGARKSDVFMQLGVESALIGITGGLVGLALAQLGLWSVRQRPDDYAHLARMDTSMLVTTVVLAVAASVVAGLLPAWRACRIAPALNLKTQ